MTSLKKKKIALVTDEGIQFSIKIGCFDTVIDMKEKIQQKKRFRVIEQSLSFNGEILPDDFNVYYATNINAPIRVNVDRPRRYGQIPNLSTPNLLEIALKLPHKFKVDGRDTIAQLKTQIPLQIESMATIPASLLILKHEGTELEDSSKTLEQCGIAADSVITVDVSQRKLDLLVKMPDSKVIPIQMCPTDKVWRLKEKINNELPEGESPTAGILAIYLGEKELADHLRLADYEIPPNEQLTLHYFN